MKKLTLIRHAKASHHRHQSDFARPLSEQGVEMAADLGHRLGARAWDPDLVLFSPAVRTRETAEQIRAHAGDEARWEARDPLYLISPTRLLQLIEGTSHKVGHLVVIGHNPSISIVAATLDHSLPPMMTSATAIFDLDIKAWAALTGAAYVGTELLLPPHATRHGAGTSGFE
jgi:phosphohistidine phosphatase